MELRSTASKTASGGVAQAHFDTSNRLSRTVHFRPGYHRNRSQSESHRVNPFSTARTQPGPSAPSANALTLPAMRGLDMSDYVVGDDGVFYFKSKQLVPYEKDWRLLSACKFMALLFKTNQLRSCRSNRFGLSEFYNPYLYSDRRDTMTINILEDFDAWQSEKSRQIFCFCQYPFILSGDAKMYIMRMDSSRQMAQKHKEALFSAFFLDSSLNAHLKLNVRRNCLVEDSLTQLNSQQTDLKKRLKISFVGEDGVDAGGLTKEWFMLLLRELMNPLYG
ncbi:putative E3 ubiquitin-protein ligase, partial [Spiromyces aspiralis]